MNVKISALIDGEIDSHELHQICVAMRQDAETRRVYGTYVLIGDALRHEPYLASEITGTVLDFLVDEPVVLAPQGKSGLRQKYDQWYRPGLALAAGAAGVAVVAWLGLATQLPGAAGTSAPLLAAQKPAVVVASQDAGDMQEYLIAHQVHSGSLYLNSEAQHIRTVALNGTESSR